MSIVADVRQLLGGGVTFWTSAHIYDAINEVQLEAHATGKHAITTSTLSINTGDDLVYFHSSIMIPQYVEYLNKRYFPTTMAKLEQFSRGWKGHVLGPPKWFALFDAERFRIFPRADQIYDMTLWGVGWPTEITASNEDITDVDVSYKSAVRYWSAAKLLLYTRPELSQVLQAEGDEMYLKFRRTLRNNQGHNIRRLRPANILQAAQTGVINIGRRVT